MSLQVKLDAFKADFEAGKPPYSVPHSVIETMHRATEPPSNWWTPLPGSGKGLEGV